MADANSTIQQLRELVDAFTRERRWEHLHTPKDLAAGLSIEASELLEIFLWTTGAEMEEMVQQQSDRIRMAEELTDILIYCLNFANQVGLDISESVISKLAVNSTKYPVDKVT